MAVEYPDVMNDIVDARRRFEGGVVQYLAQLSPRQTPAGGVAQLALTLQSVRDVPVKVVLRLALPEPRGKLRRLPQPLFRIFQPDIQLTLENGEVAQLIIPIHVQSHVPPNEYALTVHVRSEPTQEGMRIRSNRGENRVGDLKIRHPQGLGITQLVSWGFESQEAQKQVVSLVVGEAGEAPEEIDLKPQFNSLWTPQDWELIVLARREVNDRRIYVTPEVTTEALYLPFMQESQIVFGDAGVQLHVGEAIFLTKILTYTVTHLMQNAELQDCLLVPIFAYALVNEQPTDDALWLLTQLGYTHVLELAVALSFSLVEEALRREPWDPTEQRALRDFIVECLSTGANLPAEFLYLPLILGGIVVANEIAMGGENVPESLRLLAKAKAERADLFADADLRDLNDAFDRLVAKQARG